MSNISNFIQQNIQGWSLSKHLIIYSNYDVICYNQDIYHIYKSIWGDVDLAVHDTKEKESLKPAEINILNQMIVDSSLGERYKKCVDSFNEALNEFDFDIEFNRTFSMGAKNLKHQKNRLYITNWGFKNEEQLIEWLQSIMGTRYELTEQDKVIIKNLIRKKQNDKDYSLKEGIKGWMSDRIGDATEGSEFKKILLENNGIHIDIYPTGSVTYNGSMDNPFLKNIHNNKSYSSEYGGSQQKIDEFIYYDNKEFTVSMKSHWRHAGQNDNRIQSNPQRLRHVFELANWYGVESGGIGYWIFLNDALYNNINWTKNKVRLIYGSFFGNVDLFMEWFYKVGTFGEAIPQLSIHTKEDIINYLYENNKIKLASTIESKRLKANWDKEDPEFNKKLVLNNIFINALTINLSSIK